MNSNKRKSPEKLKVQPKPDACEGAMPPIDRLSGAAIEKMVEPNVEPPVHSGHWPPTLKSLVEHEAASIVFVSLGGELLLFIWRF
jgi:hypothetical protein